MNQIAHPLTLLCSLNVVGSDSFNLKCLDAPSNILYVKGEEDEHGSSSPRLKTQMQREGFNERERVLDRFSMNK